MKRLILIGGLVALSGCYKTVYITGAPVGPISPGYGNAWHMGVLEGFVEVTTLPKIDTLCPDGFSEIHTQVSPVNGVVNYLISNILYFQDIQVVCSAAPPPPPPPPPAPPAAEAPAAAAPPAEEEAPPPKAQTAPPKKPRRHKK